VKISILVLIASLALTSQSFAEKYDHGPTFGECEKGASAIQEIKTRLQKCIAGQPDKQDDQLCSTFEFKKRCGSTVTITVSDSFIAGMLCHNLSPVSTILGFSDPFAAQCMNQPSSAPTITKKIKHIEIVWDYAAYKKANPHGDASNGGEIKYDSKTGTVYFLMGNYVNEDSQIAEWIEKNL